MITVFLLTVLPSASFPAASVPEPPRLQEPQEDEFATRLADAGDDVGKLLELHKWCKEKFKYSESRAVLQKVLELDANHEEAHKGLGHHFYADQWFESYAALSAYKREEDKRMLEEEGLVRMGDELVPQAEVVFRRMKWVKDESGEWISPNTLKTRQQEAEYEELGWKQQGDRTWVPPEEFAKWDEGLFKCGEEWLALEDADAFHSALEQPWLVPGDHFVVLTTCPWSWGAAAKDWAEAVYADLVRIYGVQPETEPSFFVLNSVDQYNALANSGVVEVDGTSSTHYAYFGESWLDTRGDPPEYMGQGICYWPYADEQVSWIGPYGVRHAAAQSFAEAIDPSWDAVSRIIANPNQQFSTHTFWTEKRVPRWFRYGAAAYVERYYLDKTEGADPEGIRNWAIGELKKAGETLPFEQVFAFQLDANNAALSSHMILQSGAMLAFILDGGCPPVTEKHQAFKAALRNGSDAKAAAEELQKVLVKNKAKFDAFLTGPS